MLFFFPMVGHARLVLLVVQGIKDGLINGRDFYVEFLYGLFETLLVLGKDWGAQVLRVALQKVLGEPGVETVLIEFFEVLTLLH